MWMLLVGERREQKPAMACPPAPKPERPGRPLEETAQILAHTGLQGVHSPNHNLGVLFGSEAPFGDRGLLAQVVDDADLSAHGLSRRRPTVSVRKVLVDPLVTHDLREAALLRELGHACFGRCAPLPDQGEPVVAQGHADAVARVVSDDLLLIKNLLLGEGREREH